MAARWQDQPIFLFHFLLRNLTVDSVSLASPQPSVRVYTLVVCVCLRSALQKSSRSFR